MKWTNRASFICPYCGEMVQCEVEETIESKSFRSGMINRAVFQYTAKATNVEHGCKRNNGPQDA